MDTVNAIAHEITEFKLNLQNNAMPKCCHTTADQVLWQVLEIIDGYTNREDQEEATRVFTKS